jgi:hypothetical protein
MRSYYEHLETAMAVAKTAVPTHPTVRSSAIFPVMNLPGIHSRILFMGYWILKRNIKEILTVVNLRSEKGILLGRQTFTITEPKTYRIELVDQLAAANLSTDDPFVGSLEIEFYSTVNLFFPFPAVVINYYGPHFSTVVHTAQRVYNDFDDLMRNSQTQVPESGFNIYADEQHEPFIGLINGAEAVDNSVFSMEFYNLHQEKLTHDLFLDRLEPYEMRMIYPSQHVNLGEFLKGEVGAAKARFHVNWIFPRLIVGNIDSSLPALSITHTYYDTSGADSNSDYWQPAQEGWFDAAVMVPAQVAAQHFTNIYFYPIYSPSSFAIDVEFYDSNGKLVGDKRNALLMEAPFSSLKRIELKALAKELNIDGRLPLCVRLIGRPINNSRLPARVKIGLDVGNDPDQMPCNICTNLHPFNVALENKPKSFRWGPVLCDQPEASIWITNSTPQINYTREAEVDLTFYREDDTATCVRHFSLHPHGFRAIYPNEDPELRDFFKGKVGWFTAVTTNPYTSTYYFAENPAGTLGGDHGF